MLLPLLLLLSLDARRCLCFKRAFLSNLVGEEAETDRWRAISAMGMTEEEEEEDDAGLSDDGSLYGAAESSGGVREGEAGSGSTYPPRRRNG